MSEDPALTIRSVVERLAYECVQGHAALNIAMELFDAGSALRDMAPIFFEISTDANVDLAQTFATTLFCKDSTAVAIPSLLELVEKNSESIPKADPEGLTRTVKSMRERIQNLQPMLNTIAGRRNRTLAYFDEKFSSQTIPSQRVMDHLFEELLAVFELAQTVVSSIAPLVGYDVGSLRYRREDDVRVVLDLLTDAKWTEIDEVEKSGGYWWGSRPKHRRPYKS